MCSRNQAIDTLSALLFSGLGKWATYAFFFVAFFFTTGVMAQCKSNSKYRWCVKEGFGGDEKMCLDCWKTHKKCKKKKGHYLSVCKTISGPKCFCFPNGMVC
mmetsp:Transcript_1272/g.2605  ORF Transcript_1272/g.2605 Transcript_1272/m.2605 type:complete len:102 (+) Transcript_1272:396-701(+)